MIQEALLGTLIQEGYKEIRDLIKQKRINDKKLISLQVTAHDIQSALFDHISYINNWSQEITFKDLKRSKDLDEIYLDLNIHLSPRKLKGKNEKLETSTILKIIQNEHKHIIILGDPGSGKTTTLKHISRNLILQDEKELKNFEFPILISLRTLSEREGLYDRLKNIFGLEIKYDKESTIEIESLKKRYINRYLNKLNALVLIDGLDEIADRYDEITNELRELFLNLNLARVILTCRSGIYSSSIENSVVFELDPLDDGQIEFFITKWFNSENTQQIFLRQLKKSPYYDTAIKPLTLTQLCTLFEKYLRIPDKPKSVYERIIRLLIEEWDSQRGIERYSKYSQFDIDRKIDFLAQFAYQLTSIYPHKVYRKQEFWQVYEIIHEYFGLPEKEKEKVISEVESHNGIIIQSSMSTFEFSHKSLQEYLAAYYIVRLSDIPDFLNFSYLKDELAIAISLSSEPSEYFAKLVFNKLDNYKFELNDIEGFMRRIVIEKPEFEKTPLVPICFYYMSSKYFKNIYTSISIFERILDELCTINNFKKSFSLLENYFEITEKKEIIQLNCFTPLDCKVAHLIPSEIIIPKQLYKTYV